MMMTMLAGNAESVLELRGMSAVRFWQKK